MRSLSSADHRPPHVLDCITAISRHPMQPHDPAAGALAAAAESVAAADAAAASVPAEATILDLPEDVNAILFSQLPSARDLAACLATCRAWRTSAATPELWEAAARRRWRHGWDAPWGGAADAAPAVAALLELQRQGRWQQAYAARRQVRRAACRERRVHNTCGASPPRAVLPSHSPTPQCLNASMPAGGCRSGGAAGPPGMA